MTRCLTGWRSVWISGAVNPGGPKKRARVLTARSFSASELCALRWFSSMVWHSRFIISGLSVAWWWRGRRGRARGNAVGVIWAWSSGRCGPILPAPVRVIRPLPGSCSRILLAAKVRTEYVIDEKVRGPVSWMQFRVQQRRRWGHQAQGQRPTVRFTRVPTGWIVQIFHDWRLQCLSSLSNTGTSRVWNQLLFPECDEAYGVQKCYLRRRANCLSGLERILIVSSSTRLGNRACACLPHPCFDRTDSAWCAAFPHPPRRLHNLWHWGNHELC